MYLDEVVSSNTEWTDDSSFKCTVELLSARPHSFLFQLVAIVFAEGVALHLLLGVRFLYCLITSLVSASRILVRFPSTVIFVFVFVSVLDRQLSIKRRRQSTFSIFLKKIQVAKMGFFNQIVRVMCTKSLQSFISSLREKAGMVFGSLYAQADGRWS